MLWKGWKQAADNTARSRWRNQPEVALRRKLIMNEVHRPRFVDLARVGSPLEMSASCFWP
mgnify:FL=1